MTLVRNGSVSIKKWLHTLGNLTLTGYNSSYSDRPFAKKRDIKGGFKESPLRLNTGLGQCEIWDRAAIQRERNVCPSWQ
ncbi:HNH endonuclease family protein [Escherichia coli]|nr:HNH endonuclease family protein [Escherichia coli]